MTPKLTTPTQWLNLLNALITQIKVVTQNPKHPLIGIFTQATAQVDTYKEAQNFPYCPDYTAKVNVLARLLVNSNQKHWGDFGTRFNVLVCFFELEKTHALKKEEVVKKWQFFARLATDKESSHDTHLKFYEIVLGKLKQFHLLEQEITTLLEINPDAPAYNPAFITDIVRLFNDQVLVPPSEKTAEQDDHYKVVLQSLAEDNKLGQYMTLAIHYHKYFILKTIEWDHVAGTVESPWKAQEHEVNLNKLVRGEIEDHELKSLFLLALNSCDAGFLKDEFSFVATLANDMAKERNKNQENPATQAAEDVANEDKPHCCVM